MSHGKDFFFTVTSQYILHSVNPTSEKITRRISYSLLSEYIHPLAVRSVCALK